MATHDIVNLIVEKFGGNRVKFDGFDGESIDFVIGHNLYRSQWSNVLNRLLVMKLNGREFVQDNYSNWVQSVLSGMVRNEEGEMVPR